MYEKRQDGGVTEDELECILHTALGVTKLRVSRLFSAIDMAKRGKVTFGKKRGSVEAKLSTACIHWCVCELQR